jgi:hypothetical protein
VETRTRQPFGWRVVPCRTGVAETLSNPLVMVYAANLSIAPGGGGKGIMKGRVCP